MNVVTGSTDGIGKSYAKMLAKQGINIVLISRNLEKLQKVEHEIKSEYNVQTRIIVMDFSGGHEIYEGLGDKLKDLEIGILGEKLCWYPLCNVSNNYVLIKYCIYNHAWKKGVIVNVSSMCGVMPMPLIATYSATKAFVDFFSRCLTREYSDMGILVQCVTPGFVATKMVGNMPTNVIVPTPDQFVHQALGTIGMEPRTCGYWSHSLKV
ncbi:hypothetical protein QZH41_019789 [Actinostola sp. cb2023]|nr:hypothetical protein QZH41_019789 [Actinostola sp. cb2023]